MREVELMVQRVQESVHKSRVMCHAPPSPVDFRHQKGGVPHLAKCRLLVAFP